MASALTIDEQVNGVSVLSFRRDAKGVINLDQIRQFFGTGFLEHVSGIDRLVIDLSGVSSLDSSCLGPLVQKMREIKDKGGRLALAGVDSPALQEIFALTRFDKVFPIYATRNEALASF
ncbi:MAG: STAS domain-containing protein [Planctomycetes bacterium]|nr:STAS domain-containing protein [Planctomycetota bacterium]